MTMSSTVRWMSVFLVVGCGSTGTVAPTPVRVVEPTVDTPEEPAEESPVALHPMSVWANTLRDEVMVVISGNPPPTLPTVPFEREAQLVEGEEDLTGSRAVFVFIDARVVLTNGLESKVEIAVTDEGPRIGGIRNRGTVSQTAQRRLTGYFSPLDDFALEVVESIRAGGGVEHMMTREELLRLLPIPEVINSADSVLVSSEQLAELQSTFSEPGVEIAYIRPRTIGVMLETAAGDFVGAQLRTEDIDGEYRFRANPLVELERMNR